MLTTGSKFCFGSAALLVVLAVMYGWTSGGVDWGLFPSHLGDLYFQMLGAVTLGWRGAVGDQLGYTVLLSGAVGMTGIGSVLVALRDADAEALAEVAGTARPPAYRLPFSPNFWAPVSAFALGAMILGLVVGKALFLLGVALLIVAAFEWAMQAWADRATGDPAVNAKLRNRIMNPLEIPLLGIIGIGFVAIAFSRILLATSKLGAVWITIAAAAIIFLLFVLVAAVPKATRGVLSAAVVVAAVAVLAAGISAAAVGERNFEHHETEAGGGESHDAGTGAATTGEQAPTTTAATHSGG